MSALFGLGTILLLKINNNLADKNLKTTNISNPISNIKSSIIKNVSVQEAYENIKNKNYKIVVDIRDSKEWNKYHILGSINSKNLKLIYSKFTKKLNIPNDISGMEFIGKNNNSFMLVVANNLEEAEEFSNKLKEINVFKVDYLINKMNDWVKVLPYTNKQKLINKKNLKKLANDKIFDLVIDVRDKDEYEKKHYPNSINLPSLGTNPEKIKNLKKIEKSSHIFLHGDAKNKVERALSVLNEYGYINVYSNL